MQKANHMMIGFFMGDSIDVRMTRIYKC